MANSAMTSTGSAAAATQSEQEAGTSLATYVTPGRQQYHESAGKAWLQQSMSGSTPSILASYNVTSLTDLGVGNFRANFTTSFSSITYSLTSSCMLSSSFFVSTRKDVLATGSAEYMTVQMQSPYANKDPVTTFGLQFFGDQ